MFNKPFRYIESFQPYGTGKEYALNVYEELERPSKAIHFIKNGQPFAAIFIPNSFVGKGKCAIELLGRFSKQNKTNYIRFIRSGSRRIMQQQLTFENDAITQMLHKSFQVLNISPHDTVTFPQGTSYPQLYDVFKTSLEEVRQYVPDMRFIQKIKASANEPYVFAYDLHNFLQEKNGITRSVPQKETIVMDTDLDWRTNKNILLKDLSRDIDAMFLQAGRQKGAHTHVNTQRIDNQWHGSGTIFKNMAQRRHN